VYWHSVRLNGDWRHDYRRPGDPACCGTRDARGVASTRPTPLLLRAVLWRHASVVGADCSADSVAQRFTRRRDVILLSLYILIMECCWTAQFCRAVKFNDILTKCSRNVKFSRAVKFNAIICRGIASGLFLFLLCCGINSPVVRSRSIRPDSLQYSPVDRSRSSRQLKSAVHFRDRISLTVLYFPVQSRGKGEERQTYS